MSGFGGIVSGGAGLTTLQSNVLEGVINLAALTALDDTGLSNGTRVHVATMSDDYVLNKASALAVDNVSKKIIATNSGSGRWLRKLTYSLRWTRQTTWFVDSTSGDNENDGLTSGAALKSLEEFDRRVGKEIIGESGDVTVNLLGTMVGVESPFAIFLRPRITAWNRLFIKGTRTLIDSGTITSYTAATNTHAGILTDTGQDFQTYVGDKQIAGTSGSINNRVAWALGNTGTTTIDVTQFYTTGGAGIEPSGGETYDVYTVTRIEGGLVVEPSVIQDGGQIIFQDVENWSGFQIATPPGSTMEGGTVQLIWCTMDFITAFSGGGSIELDGCMFNDELNVSGGTRLEMYGAGFRGSGGDLIISRGSRVDIFSDTYMRQGNVELIDGTLHLSDPLMIYDNAGTDAIHIGHRGTLIFRNGIAATYLGNSTGSRDGIRMYPGARIFFPTGTTNFADLAKFTTAADEIDANGTGKTFASVPSTGFVSTADDLAIVPGPYNPLGL
jgi:hypothetical protein